MIESKLKSALEDALRAAKGARELVAEELPPLVLEAPKIKEHGDFSVNVAMALAKTEGKPPRFIAEIILRHFKKTDWIHSIEIAGSGFINFRLTPDCYFSHLKEVEKAGERYGHCELGKKKKILIEFVSANPTGPLNVVSARAAAYGDTLANLFSAIGYKVMREFYVNDVGNQIRLFAESILARVLQILCKGSQTLGEKAEVPEEGYQGEYVVHLAKELLEEKGESYFRGPREKVLADLEIRGVKKMVAAQKEVLSAFGVEFDQWFFQNKLLPKKVKQSLEKLTREKMLYEAEGATYFRSTDLGDDKDRVVKKSDGEYSYFASDIAYHDDKFHRADHVIDILGPDHHGYIARLKAIVAALGCNPENFKVLIVQQVNLMEEGKVVKMSKRAGKIIEMKDLLDEVGKDVARYFFLMRSANAHLDFDLTLAKKETPENPVFYIQYAHARISSIFEKAKKAGIRIGKKVDLSLLSLPEEKDLARKALEFPKVVRQAATEEAPHRLANYLLELSQQFQSYYSRAREDGRYRVLVKGNVEAAGPKLYLLKNIQIVLKNGLRILGVSAPDRMDKESDEL